MKWEPSELLFLFMIEETAINHLCTFSDVLYLDGTFDISELKLILTTVLVNVNEVGYLMAWFLHDRKTTEIYHDMW